MAKENKRLDWKRLWEQRDTGDTVCVCVCVCVCVFCVCVCAHVCACVCLSVCVGGEAVMVVGVRRPGRLPLFTLQYISDTDSKNKLYWERSLFLSLFFFSLPLSLSLSVSLLFFFSEAPSLEFFIWAGVELNKSSFCSPLEASEEKISSPRNRLSLLYSSRVVSEDSVMASLDNP